MSKAKKIWLPIAIVLVLAALIVLLALAGSLFSDEEETLEESPAPTEDVLTTAEPTKEKSDKSSDKSSGKSSDKSGGKSSDKSGGKSSDKSGGKSSGNSGSEKNDKDNGEKSPYEQWREFGEQVQENFEGAVEGFVDGVKNIGDQFDRGNAGGIVMTPEEFVGGVKDFVDGVFGTLTGDQGEK